MGTQKNPQTQQDNNTEQVGTQEPRTTQHGQPRDPVDRGNRQAGQGTDRDPDGDQRRSSQDR